MITKVSMLLVAGLALGGCGFGRLMPGPIDTDQRIGPEFTFGPVAVLDAEDSPTGDQVGQAVWYRIRDGHCVEFHQGTSCVGGEQLPRGFSGFASVASEERTCVDAVTSPDVAIVEVDRPGVPTLRLRPLPGPAEAPVRLFAVCWAPGVDPDSVTAVGLDADGATIGRQGG